MASPGTRALRDAALHADAERPSRRDEILRAAAQLFAERGSRAVGVDDVGAAVGVTGPAIYRHFASKDAMLAEMLVRISETLLAGGSERGVRRGVTVGLGRCGSGKRRCIHAQRLTVVHTFGPALRPMG